MNTTQDSLNSFTQFVHQRVKPNQTEPSLPELFDLWLLENPSDEEYAENVAAINTAIDDYERGERGRPAGEHSRELRQQLGIVNE